MRRRKRTRGLEINLTPLLDVLFSILFIVMLTSKQNEDSIRSDAQRKEEQIEQMEQQTAELETQIVLYENQMKSYNLYNTEAVVLTLSNIKEDGKHKLIVAEGLDETEADKIQMGLNRIENTRNRLGKLVSDYIQNTDNQPVYIVFHCDKNCIYTDEYNAVIQELEELQKSNKEVFFKVTEGEE